MKSVQEEISNRGVGTVTKDYRVLRAQRQAEKEAEAAAAERQASADMAKQVQQGRLLDKAIVMQKQAAQLEEQNKKLAAQLADLMKQEQERKAQKAQMEREKAAPVEMPNRPGWINIPVTEVKTEAPVVAFASYQPVQQVVQQVETPEATPAPAPVAPALSRAEQRVLESSPDGAARLAAMRGISVKGQAKYAQQQEEATKRGEVELQQRPAMAEASAKAQALALEQQRLTLQTQQAQQAANVQMETQQQLQQAILQMQQRQVVPQYPQVVSAGCPPQYPVQGQQYTPQYPPQYSNNGGYGNCPQYPPQQNPTGAFSLNIDGKQYGAVPNYSPFNGPYGPYNGNSNRPRNYGAISSAR